MLETRRRRKRGKKDLAGAAKRAKKLAKWNARKARAAAPKALLAAQSSDTPSSLPDQGLAGESRETGRDRSL